MRNNLFFVSLLVCLCLQGRAQPDYYFRHYQVENGLSHNTVMCTAQDAQGFLWLGTKDGLNRFDGTAFKIFRHDEDDSTTIGNGYIRALHLTAGGALYAGTQRGVYRFQPRTESFVHLSSSGKKSIEEIISDHSGNLWYIAEGTLVRHGEKTGAVKVYHQSAYFWATALCLAPDGTLWAGTADGQLKKYNPLADAFATYTALPPTAPTRWIEKIAATPDGLLVGTTAHGLLAFDTKTATVKPVLSQNSDGTDIFVRDILEYKPNEYWVATESGLFIYNRASGSMVNLKKDYRNPYALSDNAVYTLCKDREGGLWAGTFFGGVNYYVAQHAIFQKYFPADNKTSISGNAVREIVQDQYGNLWIGTEDAGLNKLDVQGRFTHYQPGGKGALAYYNIHGLLAAGDELWVGTFEHGLDVMDIRTGRVLRHYNAGTKPGDLHSNFVFSLIRTRQGEILAGTTAGVFRYRRSSDDFERIDQLSGYTYSILEDRTGVWWSATIAEGVKFFNPRTGESGSFQHQSGNKGSLSNNMVNALFEDSQGNLWAATEGGGLCRLDAQRKTWKRFNTRNGLPSNFVFKVLEDEKGALWITTSKGLVRMDRSEVLTVYTTANGLLNDQFNYSSGYRDKTGRLYFGSVKGMVAFHPDGFERNRFVPPVYITGLQVHNKELSIGGESPLQQSILYTNRVVLAHEQSSFSLDFAALSYTAPQMNAYAYRMSGVDNRWMPLDKNRKVYYTDLAPGDYLFKVKAANGSGVWNEKETVLRITILPPWWRSPAAYGLYGFLLLATVVLLMRNYHRRMKRRAQQRLDGLRFEKEKELYAAKMKFFTNIAHEIRTPLTLIKGPLERIIALTENIPAIRNSLAIMERNTNRLVELTNQLLDYRQTEAGGFTLSFQEENISKLLQEVWAGFQPLAIQHKLTYTLHLAKEPLIAYADREALTKILSNLLSNAIKYADSTVAVRLLQPPGRKSFTVQLTNDGEPVAPEMREKIFEPFVRLRKNERKQGTGIGLALARSLAELHGGVLKAVEGGPNNVFELTLPVYQERQTTMVQTVEGVAAAPAASGRD